METGRPNACTACHLDRSLGWAAGYLADWYGQPVPTLGTEERTIAASVLLATKGDAAQRALTAWSMGWSPAKLASGDEWQPLYLAQLLADPYEAVRLVAERSLRSFPAFANARMNVLALAPEERFAAVVSGLERWRQVARRGEMNHNATILLTPDGRPVVADITALMLQRNDRRVVVRE